jgi:hypothetical protein
MTLEERLSLGGLRSWLDPCRRHPRKHQERVAWVPCCDHDHAIPRVIVLEGFEFESLRRETAGLVEGKTLARR